MERRTQWFLALIVALPLLVYGPSVARDAFVSIDDSLLITENPAVQRLTLRTIAYVFSSYDPELYIPLTLLTYQVEWALVGAQPLLFHLTNLLLHVWSALFLFLLLRRMLGSDAVACVGALLFALHPVHTEAVAWASARKDVLSAFFFLGSLVFYERWRQEGEHGQARTSLVFFLCALLSKVTVSLLPLVLLLLDWRRGERVTLHSLRQKALYFALSAIFIIIALFGKAQGISSLGIGKTILLGAKATVFYFSKLLWPSHLSVIYHQTTPVMLHSPEFLVPVILLALFFLFILFFLRRWRDASFGLAFSIVTVLPNFANFWKNRFLFFASDRYAYLPSIGLIVIVCSLSLWIIRRSPQWRRSLVTGLGVLTGVLGVLTFSQTKVWQTDLTLYSNVLRWYPDSALAANNLGDALVRAGRRDEALPFFTRAVESDSRYIQAMVNAGNVERERGNYERARAWYERAITVIGSDPRVEDLAPHYLLGELLVNSGKTNEGLAHFQTAAALMPQIGEPYYNWGLQLQKLGRGDEATALFEKSIPLDPYNLAARYHLAALYAERGRLPEARDQLEKIVAVDPRYEKATEHLQNIRRLIGK